MDIINLILRNTKKKKEDQSRQTEEYGREDDYGNILGIRNFAGGGSFNRDPCHETDATDEEEEEEFHAVAPSSCLSLMDQIAQYFVMCPDSSSQQMMLGLSGAMGGWSVGIMMKKIGRATAVGVGGGVIMLKIAHQQGYISVNWNRVQNDCDKALKIAKAAESHLSKNHNNMQNVAGHMRQLVEENALMCVAFAGGLLISIGT